MPFLAPGILGFLVLASVPIIIHLLNRRRFLRVDWAPMKYLKLTIKTNRRRLRIEQLILLAIRTLAIIALICAVARPVLSSTGIGRWLGGRTRTSRVIVIDDSASMGYLVDRRAAFELAQQSASELARRIGAQDAVTAFVTSAPQTPILREAHLEDPNRLPAEIGKLAVSDTRSDWPATFKAVDQYLASATFPTREVTIVTDLRKSGWGNGVTDVANRWAGQGVALRIIDVGSRQAGNVSLAALELEDPIVLPGGEAKLRASIRNDTAAAITGAQAVLAAGDQSRPVVLPELPPGKVTDVPITLSAPKAGQVPVRLTLPNDAMPADNVRYLALNVRPTIDVQLVDGEPSAVAFDGAADFLQLAFSVGAEPWRIDKRSDSEWAGTPRVGSPDVMVLANVASISPERVAALERLVDGGMGLMIFAGEQVDPVLYNQRLYKDGMGLLPARLDRPIDGPVTGLVVEALGQSPLAPLGKLAPEALARIKARRFMAAAVPAKSEHVRVLARWNDPEGHPAILERRFGKGRVILWTVSANKQWSDWPLDPTYVLAVRSSAAAVARAEPQQDNIAAGQPIQYVMEEGQGATEAKASLSGRESAEVAAVDKPEKGPPVIRAVQTAKAGTYTLSWKDATGRAQQHLYAASVDKSESDLTPLTDSELIGLLGNLRASVVHVSAGQGSLAEQGREIWRTFAVTVLALLMFETVFAVWVGRER